MLSGGCGSSLAVMPICFGCASSLEQIGAEYAELHGGARIAFTTRSAGAGRGLSIDRLVIYEAEDLPTAEVGALAPTVFSRPSTVALLRHRAIGVPRFGDVRPASELGP